MIKLTDWVAKRSGTGISISGKDPAGNPRKVVVPTIFAENGKPVAVATDGMR